jgi:hypothetical protein
VQSQETKGQKKIKKEGDESNKQFSDTEICGGYSLSVINQSKEGQEEKCLNSRVRTEKEPI